MIKLKKFSDDNYRIIIIMKNSDNWYKVATTQMSPKEYWSKHGSIFGVMLQVADDDEGLSNGTSRTNAIRISKEIKELLGKYDNPMLVGLDKQHAEVKKLINYLSSKGYKVKSGTHD